MKFRVPPSTMKLPVPSPEALAHQQKLLNHLSQVFRGQGGWMSFADFMHHALYAPGLGYYSAGSLKFGSAGDFVTAPEISSLFSQCLARQCAQIIENIKKQSPGSPIIILELGAGSGKMAADLLLALQELNQLPSEYWILEVSADLKARQQAWLKEQFPDYFEKIHWLNRLPETPFTGIILGNEVLDAMPVHVFQLKNHQILEGTVTAQAGKWKMHFEPPITASLQPAVEGLLKTLPNPRGDEQGALPELLGDGYISEINLSLDAWINSLSHCLKQGVMLFIDYGFPRHEYYHPSRNTGTLMCHYRHHAHADPFLYIGLQDITAHVDFTAVALAAVEHGLSVEGFTHQAGFLLDNDLMGIAEKNTTLNPYVLSQQIQQLTQPHEMGELFKVIALGKNIDFELTGFQHFDQRHRL